jgi:tetratricopeptide (TPR) repeat protein
VAEWGAFLDRLPLPEGEGDLVDALFRRPTIFGKTCARVLAERNSEARAAFLVRDYRKAYNLYQRSFAEARSIESLGGVLSSALRLGEYRTVTADFDTVIAMAERPMSYLSLFLPIGDAAWAAGDRGRAAAFYRALARTDISDGLTEAALVRMVALSDTLSPERFLPFFLSDATDSARLALLDSISLAGSNHPLLQYVRGKTLIRLSRYEDARHALDSLSADALPPRLTAERLRMLGFAALRLRAWQDARMYYWNSLNYHSTDAAIEEVNDRIAWCEWLAGYPAW